jgi:hypothetical protein
VLLSASSVVYNDCRWNCGSVQQLTIIFGGFVRMPVGLY